MQFIISWKHSPAHYAATVSRFLEGGGLPPSGVTMTGRWHGVSGGGFAVAETSDPKALYAWTAEWSDLLTMEVTPCLEDEAAGEALSALQK